MAKGRFIHEVQDVTSVTEDEVFGIMSGKEAHEAV
jgi:hypothetical protein